MSIIERVHAQFQDLYNTQTCRYGLSSIRLPICLFRLLSVCLPQSLYFPNYTDLTLRWHDMSSCDLLSKSMADYCQTMECCVMDRQSEANYAAARLLCCNKGWLFLNLNLECFVWWYPPSFHARSTQILRVVLYAIILARSCD